MNAATLFFSNHFFWSESGYFDGPATMKPLLHTWSLAVEEQFYIVFPLFLVMTHRYLKGRWIIWIAGLSVASFAASVWVLALDPSAAFYLAPARAWELLLGALLALKAFPPIRLRWARESSAAAGLGAVAWSVFFFSEQTSFPGFSALFPCVGTALLIHSGAKGTMINRLLSVKPAVFVGLISYPLYLWHWPAIVYTQYYRIHGLSDYDVIFVITFSFAASVLTWRYIERPIRKRNSIFQRKRLFGAAATAMICTVGFGLYGKHSDGWPGRVSAEAVAILEYTKSRFPRERECFGNSRQPKSLDAKCVIGADAVPSIFLWGDSHAKTLAHALEVTAKRHGQSLLFGADASCPPILNFGTSHWCLKANAGKMDYILGNENIKFVVLAARWTAYLQGRAVDFGPAEKNDNLSIFQNNDGKKYEKFSSSEKEAYEKYLSDTIELLISNDKTPVIVYPIPETGYEIPSTLARMVELGQDPNLFTRPADYYNRRHRAVFDLFDGLKGSDRIIRVYPHERLCDAERCLVYRQGEPLYRDNNHLSLAGAVLIAPIFEPIFRTLAVQTDLPG